MAYSTKRSPFAGAPESADAMYPLVSGSHTNVVPVEDAGAVAEGVGTRWCAVRGSPRCQGEYRAAKSSASARATDPVALARVKRGASTVKLSNSGVFVTALIACSWFKVVTGFASRAAAGVGPVTGPPQAATAGARGAGRRRRAILWSRGLRRGSGHPGGGAPPPRPPPPLWR